MKSTKGMTQSIVIIGAGFGGLGMAIRLKQAGYQKITVLEKGDSVGGTWRENTYPGCACDVQSHLYSYSFAPNPNWSRMFAPQPEILRYLKDCAEKFDVQRHLIFKASVNSARWSEADNHWDLSYRDGRSNKQVTLQADILISAIGGLHRPAIPQLEGIENFKGEAFHSAEWRHDVDLKGRNIAVVGTGASAIQFVPAIAPKVAGLTLFQRSPAWVLPKPDRDISLAERILFKRAPRSQRTVRDAIYAKLEARAVAFNLDPRLMVYAKREGKKAIRKHIKDRALRRQLTPDYTPGCKRVLISNDYYPALARSNVSVVSDPIVRVHAHEVETKSGQRYPTDTLIYGTGFNVSQPIPEGLITGRNGIDLADRLAEQPTAYKGTSMSGFPNLFMLLGPNTGLGHNSIIYMIEAQIEYVLQGLKTMRREQLQSLEVKPVCEARYNEALQAKLDKSVWATGCSSWYLDEQGRNFTVWPGFTFDFKRRLKRFEARDYLAA